METHIWQFPSEKRNADLVVPSSRRKANLEIKDSSTVSDSKNRATTNHSSEPVCFDQYLIPPLEDSAGLETVIKSRLPSQSRVRLDSPIPKAAKPKKCSDAEPTAKDSHTDLDRGGSRPQLRHVNELCTYDEALIIRYHAREIGPERFFEESVLRSRIPLQTLCTAFGVPLATVPPDPPDTLWNNRLKKAIAADMANRIKLHKYNSIEDAIDLLGKARNIMVITGAGISTSLGIPDFRSHDGLYSRLRNMGFQDPESVFSRDAFEQDPRAFFSVASMILPPADGRFTPAHAFLRLLQDKGKLLTLYTQNIDGIDMIAGVRREKLIQLHGSFETATCVSCNHRIRGEEIFPEIRKGEVPNCAVCAKARQQRIERMIAMRSENGRSVRRKVQRSSATDPAEIMRPDIVFMGEPPRPHLKRFLRDCSQVDLVIVMGTSLPVEPVNTMPNRVPPKVPQIYIGKKQMYPERHKRIDFDIQLLGECDVIADLLAKGCGWDLRHEMLPKDTIFEIDSYSGLRHVHDIRREKGPKRHREDLKMED
jgi:NAD+-dependent protein deacetylase SIR2